MPHKDPAARREYLREYAERNRDSIRATQRRYQARKKAAQPPKVKVVPSASELVELEALRRRRAVEHATAWRAAHPEETKRYRGNERARKKEKRTEWQRQSREKADNPYTRSVLRTKYGMTLEDYNEILAAQGGVCAICRRGETVVIKGTVARLAVDHSHATKKVRGLLCRSCNVSLGLLGDDVSRVRAALTYLESHQEPS